MKAYKINPKTKDEEEWDLHCYDRTGDEKFTFPRDILQELVDKSEYIELLENMFILFSKQYSETWKKLMTEAKNDGNSLWMHIPKIQGSTLTMMIDRVAKSTKTKGNFTYEQLRLLEDNLKSKYRSDEE